MVEASKFQVNKPRWFNTMPASAYHSDPCERPSLSSSLIGTLLDQSPAHAYLEHPRLGSSSNKAEEPPTRIMQIGSVAHKLILGRGSDVAMIDASDYRSNAAKEAREQALAANKLPILRPDMDEAAALAAALRKHLNQIPEFRHAFSKDHDAERVAIWQEHGTWCRAMMDWPEIHEDHAIIWDLKSVTNAAPHLLGKHAADMGWHTQAAFYIRGVERLHPELAGKVRFRFVAVERDAPYGVTVCELDEAALDIGRRRVAAALSLFTSCLTTGEWPSYPRQLVRLEFPAWAESRWLAREETDSALPDFGPFVEVLKSMRGREVPSKGAGAENARLPPQIIG